MSKTSAHKTPMSCISEGSSTVVGVSLVTKRQLGALSKKAADSIRSSSVPIISSIHLKQIQGVALIGAWTALLEKCAVETKIQHITLNEAYHGNTKDFDSMGYSMRKVKTDFRNYMQ